MSAPMQVCAAILVCLVIAVVEVYVLPTWFSILLVIAVVGMLVLGALRGGL